MKYVTAYRQNGSKCDKSAKCIIVGSEFKLCSVHMKQKAYEDKKNKKYT